jgi:hypothetical protein
MTDLHERAIVFCLDGERIFLNRIVAMSALEASGGVLREYVQMGDAELVVTHTHLPDGSEIEHDIPGTDQHTFATEFPGDARSLRFDRYGDIVSFEGSVDDFLELWGRVKENYAAYIQVRAALVEAGKDAAYFQEGEDGVDRIDRAVFPR